MAGFPGAADSGLASVAVARFLSLVSVKGATAGLVFAEVNSSSSGT